MRKGIVLIWLLVAIIITGAGTLYLAHPKAAPEHLQGIQSNSTGLININSNSYEQGYTSGHVDGQAQRTKDLYGHIKVLAILMILISGLTEIIGNFPNIKALNIGKRGLALLITLILSAIGSISRQYEFVYLFGLSLLAWYLVDSLWQDFINWNILKHLTKNATQVD